jgi:DNA polymerase-3 subunit beta
MKVECLKENLKAGLDTAGRAVATKAMMPIFEHVLIGANGDGKMTLCGMDMEIAIRTEVEAKVAKAGTVTVPADTLAALVSLQSGVISLTKDELAPNIELMAGKTRANIKGMPAQDFPFIEDYRKRDDLPYVLVEPFNLECALRRTIFAAAKDESRPILQAVYFQVVDGGLTLYAADGFRLSRQRMACVEERDFPNLLIPRRALSEVLRIVREETEPVRIVAGENHTQAGFIFSSTQIITQLIDGRAPDFDAIIPQGWDTRISASPAALAGAIKTALIFATGKITGLRIKDERTLTVFSQDAETGDQASEIPITVEGETEVDGQPVAIFLNGAFVTDVLSALDHSRAKALIDLKGVKILSPVVFRQSGDDDFVHVAMPMHN